MKSISIDSIKYVKATDIARELGYTADYVGQLCRAEKVDAQLVGRSWYVSEDSIRSHKQTRYRSTKKVSADSIAQSLAAKDLDSEDSYKVDVSIKDDADKKQYAGQSFYKRAPAKNPSSYFTDESELIPQGMGKSKVGSISVSQADAQKVKIKSTSKEYDFSPTPRETIRFSGSLSVSEIEDNSMEEQEEAELAEDKEVTIAPKAQQVNHVAVKREEEPEDDEIANKIKVKHLRKDKKRPKKNLPMEHNSEGVVGMQRARISDRNPIGGTLKINVPSGASRTSGSGMYFVLGSIVMSVLISLIMLGLEVSVQTQGVEIVTAYSFDFSTLLAAVYSSW